MLVFAFVFYIPISCSPNVFLFWMLESLFAGPGDIWMWAMWRNPDPSTFFLKISGTQGSCTNQWQKTGIFEKKPPEAKATLFPTRGQGHLHSRPRPPPTQRFSLGIGFVSFLRIFSLFFTMFLLWGHKVFSSQFRLRNEEKRMISFYKSF